MTKKQYLLCKDNFGECLVYINEYKNVFKVKPKKKLKYAGIKVDNLFIINYDFINIVLKRKTKIKLEYFLKLIIEQMDESGDDSSSLKEALNELTRYKSIIKNKYSKFLEEKYSKLLLNKINIIEKEIKSRILYYDNINEKSVGKSR